MPEVKPETVLAEFEARIYGKVKGRDAYFDESTLAKLQSLRAMRESTGWRDNATTRQFLMDSIGEIETKLKSLEAPKEPPKEGSVPPGDPKLPPRDPSRVPPRDPPRDPARVPPAPDGVTVFSSGDRNLYFGDYLYPSYIAALQGGQRSFTDLQRTAKRRAEHEEFTIDSKYVSMNTDMGGHSIRTTGNHNHPQMSGPLAGAQTDRIGPDTEILLVSGDTQKSTEDGDRRFIDDTERLATELRKTGAHVTVLHSPSKADLDREMDAFEARIRTNHRTNFWVAIHGHGHAEEVGRTGNWARDREGSITIWNDEHHRGKEYSVSESTLIPRLNGIQTGTGAHGFFTAHSCQSGAWLARP